MTILAALVFGLLIGREVRTLLPKWLGLDSQRFPFVGYWLDGLGALAFVGLAWLGVSPALLLFGGLLVAVCVTDYAAKLIPDRLTFGGTAGGMLASLLFPGRILESPSHHLVLEWLGLAPESLVPESLWPFVLALAGALIGFLALEAIRRVFGGLVGIEVMGMGDSKLLMLIGAFLGPSGALLTLALGFLLGVVHGLAYMRLSGQPHSPFAPPLAMAALWTWLDGDVLLSAMRTFQGWILTLPLAWVATAYSLLLVVAAGLILRMRRRAAHYEQMIEEDYRRSEERLVEAGDTRDEHDRD